MDRECNDRLTVLGPRPTFQRFLRSNWDRRLHARHGELMENSPGRNGTLFALYTYGDDLVVVHLRDCTRLGLSLLLTLQFDRPPTA